MRYVLMMECVLWCHYDLIMNQWYLSIAAGWVVSTAVCCERGTCSSGQVPVREGERARRETYWLWTLLYPSYQQGVVSPCILMYASRFSFEREGVLQEAICFNKFYIIEHTLITLSNRTVSLVPRLHLSRGKRSSEPKSNSLSLKPTTECVIIA